MTTAVPGFDPKVFKEICSTCSLRELCVPGGITADELERLDNFVERRRPVSRGETLYRTGDPFRALYAVRSGTFKARVMSDNGREHVTGFQLPGELLGLDGVAYDKYGVDAIALEDSLVCVLPYTALERIARDFPPLQHQLHKVMSREIVREQDVMTLLASLRAEERVAALLVGLSERYRRLGYSATNFVLRMTREEIGNHLGLKIETVSRAFRKLSDQGLVRIDGRKVELVEEDALRRSLGTAVVTRG